MHCAELRVEMRSATSSSSSSTKKQEHRNAFIERLLKDRMNRISIYFDLDFDLCMDFGSGGDCERVQQPALIADDRSTSSFR